MKGSRPRRSAADRVLAALQTLLIGGGTALLAVYGAALLDGAAGRTPALKAFEARVAAVEARPELSGDPPDTSLWSVERIAAYQASLLGQPEAPVGVLIIDRFDLRVPIFPGTGEPALNRGLGHIEGTAPLDGQRGNVGIAGHRDGYFRQLEGIEIGDTIQVRSLKGEFRYRVRETLIVDPEDVYVLNPTSAPTMTLVTCYPFYYAGHAPRRFIVKAVLETDPGVALVNDFPSPASSKDADSGNTRQGV